MHNVVISNVPGPRERRYWNGVRLDGLYPVSLLTRGYALNITQVSYAGSMEFGVLADRHNLPTIQRMIDHFEDGLALLEKAA
jgi:diacylglycerol O-acyltransferase